MTVAEIVDSIPIIDQHAHPVVPVDEETSIETFASYFSESQPNEHARHTLNYRAALSLLADHFNAADEETLFHRRRSVSTQSFTRELLEGYDLEAVILDTGFPSQLDHEDFAAHFPAEVHPLLRIETLLERLIEGEDTFDEVVEAFESRVEDALRGRYVGLKSIAAYRCGLAIESPSVEAAREAFGRLNDRWNGRLEDRTFLSYALHLAAERAAHKGAPIQFHTGLGDIDAHPQDVEPAHLFDFLQHHQETQIVLLHAGYPAVRQAGYITSILPNAYLDLGLAVPFVQHGCKDVMRAALELTPTTKILYSSDACFVPERYVLGIERIRTDLPAVLDSLVRDGFMTESYAETTARYVLRENAVRLYDL